MTEKEALSRHDRIRYNLLNREDKEAVDVAFDALRERDALMAEINGMCHLCRHYNNGSGSEVCHRCGDDNNFEWRGARKCTACDGGFGDNTREFAELGYEFCPRCGRRLEEETT